MSELRLELYPELESEDLVAFMRRLLVAGGYGLEGVDGLTLGDRSAGASCAGVERLFIVSLRSKGVSYGAGNTPDALLAAQVIGSFVIGRWSVDAMAERFPFFCFHESARAHELGRFLDHVWESRLLDASDIGELLEPLVRACAARPRLRALFPFTSHEVLSFSRTTGFPYDVMQTCARPVFDPSAPSSKRYVERFVPGRYEVLLRGAEPIAPVEAPARSLGSGDAAWAAATLEREVPAAWGSAFDGTKDDLRR